MDLTITRFKVGDTGCFGTMTEPDGTQVCVTAEHAYLQDSGDVWLPKVPAGTYLCSRGHFQLSHGPVFETFEVKDVPGHWGILIHKGNLPEVDSEGCFLLGDSLGSLNGQEDVANSADAFQRFMALQEGVNEFWVTIK